MATERWEAFFLHLRAVCQAPYNLQPLSRQQLLELAIGRLHRLQLACKVGRVKGLLNQTVCRGQAVWGGQLAGRSSLLPTQIQAPLRPVLCSTGGGRHARLLHSLNPPST